MASPLSPLSPLSPSSAVVTDPAGPSSLIDAGWVETRPYRAAQRPSRPLGTCGRTTTRPIEPAALGTIDGTTPDSGHGEDQDFPKGIASTSRACAHIARRGVETRGLGETVRCQKERTLTCSAVSVIVGF
jgi:hypothetical protein